MIKRLLVLLLCLPAFAQNRFPPINIVNIAPAGACTPANSLEQYNGDIYTCDPSTHTWRLLTGSSLPTPIAITSGGTNAVTSQSARRNLNVPSISVLDYGAISDAQSVVDGQMTAGSNVLSSPSAPFHNTDVGKTIEVQGAGTSGNPLITTVAGFTDTSHVTLTTPASTSTLVGVPDSYGLTLTVGGTGYYSGVFATTTSGSGTGAQVSIITNYGLSSVTAATGGSITGTGTCVLTPNSTGLTSSTVTATITSSGSWTGATFVINAPGWSPSNQFSGLTATMASGTATCSGTGTLTATGGIISAGTTGSGMVIASGHGYALGDKIYPTVSGSDGTAYYTVTKIDGAGVIWGTDNFSFFTSAFAAGANGKIVIPMGNYMLNVQSGTGPGFTGISIPSNTSVEMDRGGTVYEVGLKSVAHGSDGWGLFIVPDRAVNVQVRNLNCVGGNLAFTGLFALNNPACLNLGNYLQNVSVQGSLFSNLWGHGIHLGQVAGTNIDISRNTFQFTQDSGVNVNANWCDISHNSFLESVMETAGGQCHYDYNTFVNGIGNYIMSLGGITSGIPYLSSSAIGNVITNPATSQGAIITLDGFSRGLVASNTISGLTGTQKGILGEYTGFTHADFDTYESNDITGNSSSDAFLISGIVGPKFRNNKMRGFHFGLLANGVTGIDSHGNIWNGSIDDVFFENGAQGSLKDTVVNNTVALTSGSTLSLDSEFHSSLGTALTFISKENGLAPVGTGALVRSSGLPNIGYGGTGPYQNLVKDSQFQVPATNWPNYSLVDPALTVTTNTSDFTDPYGTNTAEKVVLAGSLAPSGYQGQVQAGIFTYTAAVPYTFSIWARGAAGGENFRLGMTNSFTPLCDPNSNQLPTFTLTTTWQIYQVTCTPGAQASMPVWTTFTGGATIYLFGAHLEQGAPAGLYIATTSATVAANKGMVFQGALVAPVQPLSGPPTGGYVSYIDQAGVQHGSPGGTATIITPPVAFSALPTCNGAAEGSRGSVNDSTTATYAATITGGGSNHVPAYCDGTNWIVD